MLDINDQIMIRSFHPSIFAGGFRMQKLTVLLTPFYYKKRDRPIITAASRQKRQKSRSCSWASLPTPRGSETTADDVDIQLVIIKNYIDDLGCRGAQMDRSALANMCQIVLGGGSAKHNLKERVFNTIIWQENQMHLVGYSLEHLLSNGLIFYNVDGETAKEALAGHIDKLVLPILRRFNEVPEIAGLQSPPWEDGYLDIFFQDAFQQLVTVLAYNQLLEPDRFNIKKVQAAVVKFLRGPGKNSEKSYLNHCNVM